MPNDNDALSALRPLLEAMDASEVRQPDRPMAVFTQHGRDLSTFLAEHGEVRFRVLQVGVPEERLAALPRAIAAAQAAESAWQAVYSPRKASEIAALETKAAELRSDTVAALRWNLRGDRIAQGTLDAIQEGHGTPDLLQDLRSLAALIEQHPGAFASDQTFDPSARVSALRESARELSDATSQAFANMSRTDAKSLRDRAFTYADELLDEVREAGRYAFRTEPDVLTRFQDRYSVKSSRKNRKKASASPVREDA